MRKTTRPSVADRVQPSAPLEIDGRKYQLVYDFNAIADTDKETGCNLLHGISAAFLNTLSASQMRGLFYAALRVHHPEMTLVAAGAMIRIDTMPDIMQAISKAYNLSMPEKKTNPPAAGDAPAES